MNVIMARRRRRRDITIGMGKNELGSLIENVPVKIAGVCNQETCTRRACRMRFCFAPWSLDLHMREEMPYSAQFDMQHACSECFAREAS